MSQTLVHPSMLSNPPVRSGVKNLTGQNNSGTPNTQYDFAADEVVLLATNGNAVLRTATGTLTCNVSTAGPAANGRDQAGAFSAASWVHFWFIWNGTTLATLASASATNPTLPSGYTHRCYIGAVYFNGSSQLLSTRFRGSRVFYRGVQNALTTGGALSETAVSLAALVPPNALLASLRFFVISATGGAAGDTTARIRLETGVEFFQTQDFFNGTTNAYQVCMVDVPNVNQNVFYLVSATTGGCSLTLQVLAYTIPNGDV